MVIAKTYLFRIFLVVVAIRKKSSTVNSCPRFHPYNNKTSVLSRLTPELVDCFESCNRKRACKGINVSKEEPPQCTLCVGEFPSQLGSFNNVWIKECPEGFARNIYEQQCYLLVETEVNWYQAEEYCRSKNAYLVELIEPQERDAVWNYVRGKEVSSWIRLGVVQSDPQAVGQWRDYKWKRSNETIPSTGEVWENRYLPYEAHPEACGFFITNSFNSLLHDVDCSHLAQFVCEW